jgi:hypothetical protein
MAAAAGAAWPVAAAIGLSLVVTAGFWLPSVVELRYTQSAVDLPAAGPLRDWPRFYSHLLPAAALVEWPAEPGDGRLLNAPVSRTLGVGQAALAVVGVGAVLRRRNNRLRGPFLIMLAVVAGSLFLASDLSFAIWERVAALRFIQLPTRFLGPASMGLALLAGLGVETLLALRGTRWPGAALYVVSVAAVSASGWAWLFPRYCPLAEPVSRAALVLSSDWSRRQAESAGEVLPRWVSELPDQEALTEQYLAGQPVNRLRWPAGAAQLLDWSSRPAWDVYDLEVTQPGEFVYRSFYFPGWQVRLDEAPVKVRPTSPGGLMAFDVPAGRHTLSVSFHRTPLRQATLLVSLIAVLGTAAVWVRAPRRASGEPKLAASRQQTALMAGTALGLVVLYFGVQGRVDSPLVADRLRAWQANADDGAGRLVFGNEVVLLDRRLPARVTAGRAFNVTLYWAALTDLGVPYGMDVRVVDDAGREWGAAATRPFGYADFPGTESWPLDAYARDAYQVRLRAGTPPGTYWVETSVFRRDVTAALMPAAGAPTGDDPAHARIGTLEVSGVQPAVDASMADVDIYAPQAMAPGLSLAGWSVPEAALASGDVAHVELLWSALVHDSTPRPAALDLIGSDGTVAGTHLFRLGGERFPITAWPARSVIRDQLDMRLSPALPAGEYVLRLTVQQAKPVTLGQLTLTAPTRSFESPPADIAIDQALGFARLAGFTLNGEAAPGSSMALELTWQALAETQISYRVFVHLRDSAGGVRAQADGVPVGWTRPTTGWLPGEYLLDPYGLALPNELEAGAYHLVAGLYDPATGERLGEALLTTVGVE